MSFSRKVSVMGASCLLSALEESRDQHDRPCGLARFEIAVRLWCILERVGVIDFDAHLSAANNRKQIVRGLEQFVTRSGVIPKARMGQKNRPEQAKPARWHRVRIAGGFAKGGQHATPP